MNLNHITVNVPPMFQAPAAVVKRKWRAFLRDALHANDFKASLGSLDVVSIDDLDGRLILTERPDWPMPGDIQFGHIFSQTGDIFEKGLDINDIEDRDIWYDRMRRFLLAGINESWFCFGILAHHAMPLFPVTKAADANSSVDAKLIVPHLLQWWPELQRLDNRICGTVSDIGDWSRWGIVAVKLFSKIGIPTEDLRGVLNLDSSSAAKEMAKWLRSQKAGQVQSCSAHPLLEIASF